MKKLCFLLAIFALTVMQAQAQPTPREILKLALGVSDAQLPKVYEIWGEKLGTVNVVRDTVWDISPVTDSLGVTTIYSVVSHVNKTSTPRPAYAYEILSHWRSETIDEWKAKERAKREEEAVKRAKQAVPEPQF